MKYRQRIVTFLAYAFPCAVLFAVHYNALRTWFFMDDFAWLGLRLEYHTPSDLVSIFFEPRAQGTVRTLSERLFFLVFSSVFGMKAGPFHYWVFATQCGSLVLAAAIVRRLSGSLLAGIAAATVWAFSHSTSIALAWLSAYNEILCGFLMLASFYCLIRFVEHGERRFWILQWIAYLTAFLALEVTVVYPAVACLFVWLAARQYFKKALWLWVPALIFTAIHFLLIPKHPGAAYRMTFDLGIVRDLGRYAFSAVGPSDLSRFTADMPGPAGWWVAVAMAALLAIFLASRLAKRDWLPLMGVAWFVFFLGPVLPLQNHFTEYYSTIASFGFAALTGLAFQAAFRSGWTLRIAALAAVSVLAWCEVVQSNLMERWYRTNSGQMHILLNGIDEIAHRRSVNAIMLDGVSDELYISGLMDNPLRLFGIQRVYLLPGSERLITSVPAADITMRTDRDMADQLISEGKTAVAAFDGRGVMDATEIYRAMAKGSIRLTVLRMNDLVWSSRLRSGWNDVENEYRWMQRKAVVVLDTPVQKTARVQVRVYCPQTLLDQANGKLEMRASVEGMPVGTRAISEGQQQLVFDPLPAGLFGRKELEITLELNHVVVPPGDGRELGVPVFEIALKAP